MQPSTFSHRHLGCHICRFTLAVTAALVVASACGGANFSNGPPALVVPRTSAESEPSPQPIATPRQSIAQRLLGVDDAKVTKTLIDLASDPRIPDEERADARQRLALRRSGTNDMLAALAKGYEFSSERRPPVGPLADALAAMREKRAAPLLARQLNEPTNSSDDIERAASALKTLATPAEVDELKLFFTLFNATADDDPLVRAVLAVAETLLRIGGEQSRELVQRAAANPATQPDVRRGLEELPKSTNN